MPIIPRSVLALDVGSKRIGVAVATLIARLPCPLITLLANDTKLMSTLETIIQDENVERLVIGLPRGMEGQQTAQTVSTLKFTELLKAHFDIPIDMQDEALTSKHAEQELQNRRKPYQPGDIDALAATYILDDWFKEHQELTVSE
jgi:putative Holliday junction resolvase